MSEALVLMRALRDMNLPKFVFEDVPLFLGLINDLFPGMDCPRVRYPTLNDIIELDLKVRSYVLENYNFMHSIVILNTTP
jgi:dynein heavy chain